jgi:hypothetical protein
VICTLGPPLKRKYDDFSVLEGHKNIVKAMESEKTKRFITPNNKPLTGKVKITFGDTKINWGISRANIADFILKQTKDIQYIRSMPIIGS